METSDQDDHAHEGTRKGQMPLLQVVQHDRERVEEARTTCLTSSACIMEPSDCDMIPKDYSLPCGANRSIVERISLDPLAAGKCCTENRTGHSHAGLTTGNEYPRSTEKVVYVVASEHNNMGDLNERSEHSHIRHITSGYDTNQHSRPSDTHSDINESDVSSYCSHSHASNDNLLVVPQSISIKSTTSGQSHSFGYYIDDLQAGSHHSHSFASNEHRADLDLTQSVPRYISVDSSASTQSRSFDCMNDKGGSRPYHSQQCVRNDHSSSIDPNRGVPRYISIGSTTSKHSQNHSYSSEAVTAPCRPQTFDVNDCKRSDPVRGVPKKIAFGSTFSNQSLGYRSEHGFYHPIANDDGLKLSYNPTVTSRSFYPYSYGIASHSKGQHDHSGHKTNNKDHYRSDPIRRVPRSKSYDPTPYDLLDQSRRRNLKNSGPSHGVDRDPIKGISCSSITSSIDWNHRESIQRNKQSQLRSENQHNQIDKMDHLRGVSRSKSYDQSHYDLIERKYVHEEYSTGPDLMSHRHPDLRPGVSRSRSYDLDPCHHMERTHRGERQSHHPITLLNQADRRRCVPRSTSLQSHAFEIQSNKNGDCGNARKMLCPRGTSLVHSNHSSTNYYQSKWDRERETGEANYLLHRNHKSKDSDHQRLSDVRNSFHNASLRSLSSYDEFFEDEGLEMEHIIQNEKRSSENGAKESSRLKLKSKTDSNIKDEKEESVKDGELDAYRAMANASERIRKKKLNHTSYVKVTLGNGMKGYVKSIQN